MTCGKRDWTPDGLAAFERRIADRFLAREIRCPIHLSGGNEKQLIGIFQDVAPGDWVLSTHRSHYHALLHGISPEWVEAEILAGRSMHLNSPEHRFLTSAIVGGIAPIAVGIAMGLKRDGDPRGVWCFLGDMAAEMGIVHEAVKYVAGHGLKVRWVIEDNGLSTETPTLKVWGLSMPPLDATMRPMHFLTRYSYKRQWPHVGVGAFVHF
mgnify:CR=1 FL=1